MIEVSVIFEKLGVRLSEKGESYYQNSIHYKCSFYELKWLHSQ